MILNDFKLSLQTKKLKKANSENNTFINEQDKINIYGARVHNLKNVSLSIPRNKLTVITGLSGSGKSSLAFDVIHAEGQRRYLETFSAYARQFIGGIERPDVEKITGLSPVISIEQKTTNKNPRSTVGTITEIYDFLRLLYARASKAYSYNTGAEMIKYSEEEIVELLLKKYENKKMLILAPVVKGRKGHYKELFVSILRKGFIQAFIDGKLVDISPGMQLNRYQNHNVDIVIDKIKISEEAIKRLRDSVSLALHQGNGVLAVYDVETQEHQYFSKNYMCPDTFISYNEPAPHSFSFNSPHGACQRCNGLGVVTETDIKKIIPDDSKSIHQGGIVPLGKYKSSLIFWQIESILLKYGATLKTPIKEIPEEALHTVLYGSVTPIHVKNSPLGSFSSYSFNFQGIINFLLNQNESGSKRKTKFSEQFIVKQICPECNGQRLNKESLHFKIDGKNISELAQMDISELYKWFENIEERLDEKQNKIAKEILKEIRARLSFLLDVGLDYLFLNRQSKTLSGGESQRIRLATQIGSKLINVLYILDEPSIGLHQRDNEKLIESLKKLRDAGNSIIVVEHDKDMILSADYIVDIGPGAGKQGGEISFAGTKNDLLKSNTITAQYLNGKKSIPVPGQRRKGNGKFLELKGASGNNLKSVSVKFPLGTLICVTGVSGSGKSTLINSTLHPILSKHFYRSLSDALPYKSIEGIENIDKVIEVNQTPLGRTPRSNPATYTKLFDEIRKLFEQLPEAKIRGYKAGRFSFNVKGGRCEVCKGAGVKTIEMNFLPDVYVECDACHGKRYNRETLEVRYKGKSISDVLEMTINTAVDFFEAHPQILKKLEALKSVGLGYIKLGQASTTLSGGEAQRVKLANELAKKDTGNTLYILDEPTTGLHFEDINVLMNVIDMLVDRGNTVIIIEHNLDVIKKADYIIDLGLEGGRKGGEIIATGTPEEIVKQAKGYTAKFLKDELK